MTPATIVRVVWTTRRGFGVVIAGLMLAISLLLYSIAMSTPPQVVRYGSDVYVPLEASYCPGDVMRYHNRIVVHAEDVPAILHVVEGWHDEARGITLRSTVSTYELPLVRPTDLDVITTRQIPDLPAGVYWFDHVARNGTTTGYTVGPVVVADCP